MDFFFRVSEKCLVTVNFLFFLFFFFFLIPVSAFPSVINRAKIPLYLVDHPEMRGKRGAKGGRIKQEIKQFPIPVFKPDFNFECSFS